MAISDRDFGNLEAKVSNMEGDLQEVKGDLRAVKDDVRKILLQLSEARGGWKVLSLISGASAVVGGLIVKIFPHFIP